ncbi:MAG TPA: hypothetical protein VFE33_10790 [Thermoanaerobaculia bacterium]|nr:hypothetical protein [Thermoanaerobaculia bacterium]
MPTEKMEGASTKLTRAQQWQAIADIIAKLAIPVALAYASYVVAVSMKEQDVRVKMTEVALDILKEEPKSKTTEADDGLRRWAMDLMDEYSTVRLPKSVRAQLATKAFPVGDSSLMSLVDGPDVTQLLSRVALSGGPEDPNSKQWVAATHAQLSQSKLTALEGKWSGRWNKFSDPDKWHVGEASILVHGDYFVLVYSDPDSEFLMIGRQEEDGRLAGRHYAIHNFRDSSPWVGVLVDKSRIDGQWRYGRWDFQRAQPANTADRANG